MEALFKKYFWVVKMLGIAASAGLGASAITTQLGSSALLDSEDADAAAVGDTDGEESDPEDDDDKPKGLQFGANPFATPTSKVGIEKQKTGSRVTDRNIFCPTCLPVVTPESETPGMIGGPGGDMSTIKPGEIRSSLPLKLTATMEATDPEYSLATVYDSQNGISGLYGRGDAIRPNVVVMSIDQGVLHLRNHSQLEYLMLGDAAPPPAPAPAAVPIDENQDKPPNDREIEGAEDAINCSSEDVCTVDRKFVESLMANPAQLAKQARIVPSQKDGETQGYKMYGIRRGTIPKLLGFKNGDMLKTINGEELTSVDKAMGLYTKLRRASNLSVTIERKGKTVTKEITIQ